VKRAAVVALAALPFAAVAAGVVAGRLNARPAAAEENCEDPSMRVFFDGQVFSAEPVEKQDDLRCVRDRCFVDGPERVELHRDGGVRCLAVETGTTLELSARSNAASMIREERPQ
jgi:hypothetical protein